MWLMWENYVKKKKRKDNHGIREKLNNKIFFSLGQSGITKNTTQSVNFVLKKKWLLIGYKFSLRDDGNILELSVISVPFYK